MALPKMRTISQTVKELKEEDPNTAINEHSLRKLIKSGVIPHVTAGRKALICLDTVKDYLGGQAPEEQAEIKQFPQLKVSRYITAVNGIKRIAE